MSTEVLSTFQVASFRGVEFLFEDNSQTGGRKQKVFEYPNRDTRFVEDLGLLQRTYKMKATIADSSSSYNNSKQLLIDALETEGSGTLVHPTDGIRTVFSLPYTLDESITHTGTAVFGLTFLETGEQIFPGNSPSAASLINQQLNNLITEMNENFQFIWQVTPSYPGNITYSASVIQEMINSFEAAGNIVTDDPVAFSNYTDELNNLRANKYRYTTDEGALTASLQNLFSIAGQLGATSEDNLLIMRSFFNYDPLPVVNQTTVPTEEREKNRLMGNQFMNSMALAYYYFFAANISFENETDIIEQKDITNQQSIIIADSDDYSDLLGNNSQILNLNTVDILEDLRINSNNSLDAQIAASRKVVDIFIQGGSLLSLVFSYYGDVDLYDEIYNLNGLADPANLFGDFKVLSDGN